MGYVGWIGTFEGKKGTGKEKVFESEMTRELRNLGALLYCKTSAPHTLMSGETVNNVIGYTWNPKNRYLSSGGSSGGEGALIGLKGSPLGFGTDIAGSIRSKQSPHSGISVEVNLSLLLSLTYAVSPCCFQWIVWYSTNNRSVSTLQSSAMLWMLL